MLLVHFSTDILLLVVAVVLLCSVLSDALVYSEPSLKSPRQSDSATTLVYLTLGSVLARKEFPNVP